MFNLIFNNIINKIKCFLGFHEMEFVGIYRNLTHDDHYFKFSKCAGHYIK